MTVLLRYAAEDNLLGAERDVTVTNSQAIFEAALTRLAESPECWQNLRTSLWMDEKKDVI